MGGKPKIAFALFNANKVVFVGGIFDAYIQ